MGTKNNPGEFDCYQAAEPDEPMFVLLARDSCAPILVEFWAFLRHQKGCENHAERCHDKKILEALNVSQSMRDWYAKNR